MQTEKYTLLPNENGKCAAVILSSITNIKIKVLCLGNEGFTPNPKEVQLYGECEGKPFVFETVGLTVSNGLDVFSAVRWYATQVSYPEIHIANDMNQLNLSRLN